VVDAVRHRHRLGKAAGTRAAELMAAPVLTVPLGTSVADAVRLMVRLDVKHLPVMDARGRLAGIVTRSELLKVFLRPDPAIRWEVDHDVVRGKLGIAAGEIQVEVRDGWSACVARWSATVRLRRWSGACRPWMVWSRSTPGSPGASTTR
jgi:CBS domain-containing protein